jgi:3-hydroxybutyryl-CoA dehydrogenase
MSVQFERVGVVGCGLMGAGIAEVCARAGSDVLVAVTTPTSADRGRARIKGSLDRAVAKGKLTEEQRDQAVERIRFTAQLPDLADRQLVVEAVREHEPLKLDVFAMLGKVVEDDAVLASTTSSLPISRLAAATSNPSRVLGVHFFNPVPVLPLVELVAAVLTDPATVDTVESFVTTVLGKTAIRTPDRAGFVVNALLFPYLLSAIRMVESGVATAEVVDRGMEQGCAHPMGPLRLADLIGLDTTVFIAEALHTEFREPVYAPPSLLLRMVESGLLGRKSGRGFYSYA